LGVQHYSQGVLPTALAPTHPDVERAQKRLSHPQRTAAWDEGSAMRVEEAIAEALGLDAELPAQAPHKEALSPLLPGLTRREREVAALLARAARTERSRRPWSLRKGRHTFRWCGC
jgi:hypothetical protein